MLKCYQTPLRISLLNCQYKAVSAVIDWMYTSEVAYDPIFFSFVHYQSNSQKFLPLKIFQFAKHFYDLNQILIVLKIQFYL